MKPFLLFLSFLFVASLASAEIRTFNCDQQAVDRGRCPDDRRGSQVAEFRVVMSTALRTRLVSRFSQNWPPTVTCSQEFVDSGDCTVVDLGDPSSDPPIPPSQISNPVTRLMYADRQFQSHLLEQTYQYERRKTQREAPQPLRDEFYN